MGTHAHELIMITTRLLASYDDRAGGEGTGPVPITALLAHLLFLRANGGLATATALADTFGTTAFVEARTDTLNISPPHTPSTATLIERGQTCTTM